MSRKKSPAAARQQSSFDILVEHASPNEIQAKAQPYYSPVFLRGCHPISQTCTPQTVQAKNTQTVLPLKITTYFCRPWAWSISMPEITTNFCCCFRAEIGSDFLEYIADSAGIYLIDLQMRVLLGRRSARSRYASSCASVNWTFPPGTA